MTDQSHAGPARYRFSTLTKVLLVPSWVVGFAAALMALDFATHVIREPYSQIVGHTVLFGAFLAPVASLFGVAVAAWHTFRELRHAPVMWACASTLVALLRSIAGFSRRSRR